MDEVARLYGFTPNRAGFIRCPFHEGDHTASLKIYPGNRGWCCFGCHKGGSTIDFVKELYGLDFRQAAFRLDHDLHLGMTGAAPGGEESALMLQRKAEEAQRKKQREEYEKQWERSIELTREIDRLSDQVFHLLQEREEVEQWMDEHHEWGEKR